MAEGGMPAVSAEITAEIESATADNFAHYIANRTAEEIAEDEKKTEKFQTDEEYKGKMMAGLTQAFTDADANNDGQLDEQEFKAFHAKLNEMQKERGEFVDEREGQADKWYSCASRIQPETTGISMMDFFAVMGVSMKKFLELKAASKQ